MDDALRGDRLDAADGSAFEQGNAISGLTQTRQGPEAGDAAAEDCYVESMLCQFASWVVCSAARQFI